MPQTPPQNPAVTDQAHKPKKILQRGLQRAPQEEEQDLTCIPDISAQDSAQDRSTGPDVTAHLDWLSDYMEAGAYAGPDDTSMVGRELEPQIYCDPAACEFGGGRALRCRVVLNASWAGTRDLTQKALIIICKDC